MMTPITLATTPATSVDGAAELVPQQQQGPQRERQAGSEYRQSVRAVPGQRRAARSDKTSSRRPGWLRWCWRWMASPHLTAMPSATAARDSSMMMKRKVRKRHHVRFSPAIQYTTEPSAKGPIRLNGSSLRN